MTGFSFPKDSHSDTHILSGILRGLVFGTLIGVRIEIIIRSFFGSCLGSTPALRFPTVLLSVGTYLIRVLTRAFEGPN